MAFTTLSSWGLLLWDELQQRGLNAQSAFTEAGLDSAKLKDPNARFPMQNMQRLWQSAANLTQDPALGIAVGQRWNPTTFHALGYAWLASATLAEGFHRLARYGRLVNDGSDMTLTSAGTEYRFSTRLRNAELVPNPTASEACVTAIVKMCRMLLGESFTPLEIGLPQAPSASTLPLETRLRAPLRFNQPGLELVLSRQDMEQPLNTANAELSRINEQIVMKHLAELDKSDLAVQVRSRIVEALPSGRIREDDIANTLHLSTRTLQRRLLEEGFNFGELLQTTRRELAENYISDSQLNINEIAYLLGFSDQANFTRAFRRWFDTSPTAFRRTQKEAV